MAREWQCAVSFFNCDSAAGQEGAATLSYKSTGGDAMERQTLSLLARRFCFPGNVNHLPARPYGMEEADILSPILPLVIEYIIP